MANTRNKSACHICGSKMISTLPGYQIFHQVTSDCRPWNKGSQLGVCSVCGCTQKVIDRVWQSETNAIYNNYSIYHQSQGAEQMVFSEKNLGLSPRSEQLLSYLAVHTQLPKTGRLLDIGCGNGSLLQIFNRFRPQWSLVGIELDAQHKEMVEAIKGVEAMYTCPPDKLDGKFDLITMIHVLEHILTPKEFVAKLWKKLEWGGLIVIQIPDYTLNPFDLLISDHCTHFTAETITKLIESAGFSIVLTSTDWIPKELTVIARKDRKRWKEKNIEIDTNQLLNFTDKSLSWLETTVNTVRKLASMNNFGLFGTSIAATWLFFEINESADFFVDEDSARVGKIYLKRPVYHPKELPVHSSVFIALPTKLAEVISQRLIRSGASVYLPPSLNLKSNIIEEPTSR